jgi:hypothetical protein
MIDEGATIYLLQNIIKRYLVLDRMKRERERDVSMELEDAKDEIRTLLIPCPVCGSRKLESLLEE